MQDSLPVLLHNDQDGQWRSRKHIINAPFLFRVELLTQLGMVLKFDWPRRLHLGFSQALLDTCGRNMTYKPTNHAFNLAPQWPVTAWAILLYMCKHHLKITIKMSAYDSECLPSKTWSYLKTIYTSKTGYQMTVVHTQLVSPNENREAPGCLGREASRFKNASERSSSWPLGKEQLPPHSYKTRVAQGKHVVHWFTQISGNSFYPTHWQTSTTPKPTGISSPFCGLNQDEAEETVNKCLQSTVDGDCSQFAALAKSNMWYGNKLDCWLMLQNWSDVQQKLQDFPINFKKHTVQKDLHIGNCSTVRLLLDRTTCNIKSLGRWFLYHSVLTVQKRTFHDLPC